MNVNVLKILENCPFFEFYFKNRNYILGTIIMLLIMILLIVLILKWNYKNLWKPLNGQLIFKDMIIGIGVLLVGMFLNIARMNLNLKLNYMPMLLFFYGFILITIIQFIEFIIYRNTYTKVIKRTFNIYIGMIEAILLLLMVMNRVEVIEAIAAVLSIVTLKILDLVLDNKNIIDEDEDILKEDCPIKETKQLFPSRQKQLKSICAELKRFHRERESYAVAISGKWGSGKTSFINALKSEMEEDAEFIYITCTIGYDAEAILNEMSLQMMDVFKRNGMYILQNGIIEEYFNKVAEFTCDVGDDKFSKIIDGFMVSRDKSYFENRNLINEELEKFYNITNKNIYFIVDDMDRIIDNSMKTLLFQVVRESVSLNHCITLFMVDYEQLINENMSREFLEKYISYQYELYEVEFSEMINHYLNIFLKDDFFADKSQYIQNQKEIIRSDTRMIITYIRLKINEAIKKLEEQKNKDNNKQKIEWLNKITEIIKEGTNNPRKVKRYLNNIERMIFIADLVWFRNEDFWTNEYSKASWRKNIIQISFLKIFFKDVYAEMIQAKSFYYFRQKEQSSFIAEYIIDDYNDIRAILDRNEEILEKLVYQMYILDIERDKPEYQLLMEEINSGKMKVDDIQSYIYASMGGEIDYEALNKVLYFVESKKREKIEYLYDDYLQILEGFNANGHDLHNPKLYSTLKRVKKLVDDYIENNESNEKMLSELQRYIKEIERLFVFRNNGNIRAILGIFYYSNYDEKLQEKIWEADTISGLYSKIKEINNENKWIKFDIEKTEIENLQDYFIKMKLKLQDKEFSYIKTEALYFLEPILSMLDMLQVFSKEPKKYIQVDLKNLKFENFDGMKKRLEEVIHTDFKEDKLENIKEQYENLLLYIEQKHIMCNYSKVQQSELISLLKETYKILTHKIYFCPLSEELANVDAYKKEPDEKWKYCKIRIYRIEKKIEEGMYCERSNSL